MKKVIIIFITLTIILILANFCNVAITPNEETQNNECTDLPSDELMQIFDDKCGMCHGKEFETKELTCQRKDLIYPAVETDYMPKVGELSEEEKKAILDWSKPDDTKESTESESSE